MCTVRIDFQKCSRGNGRVMLNGFGVVSDLYQSWFAQEGIKVPNVHLWLYLNNLFWWFTLVVVQSKYLIERTALGRTFSQ